MEDIKKIQEFFSKPLNEVGERVTIEDFKKVVDAVKQSNQPATVMFVPKWNDIDIIVGMDAPDPITDAILDELYKLGDIRKRVSISGDSSSYSRREYEAIERVNGGHKDYYQESLDEMDINDPVMMKMRAEKDKLAKIRATNAGDDGNDKFFKKSTADAKKLAALKKYREQLMRDMEQEAEPEGGPIADKYGAELNKIDKAIAMLQGSKKGGMVDPYSDHISMQNAMFGLEEADVNEGGVAGWKKASMSMVKHVQKQLDDMGIKYEMGDTPYAPFKTIYKPINKSDDWYDKFDDLIWRANLRGVVKTSMNEAFGEQYYLRVRLKDSPEAMKAFDDFIGKNDFRINKGGDQFSTDDVKAGIKLYRHLTDRFVKVFDHNLPLEDKTIPVYEAEETYTVAGRPVTLNKGKKSNGTDWTVTFKNGKSTPLSDVLALIKPFPKGITMKEETINTRHIEDHEYMAAKIQKAMNDLDRSSEDYESKLYRLQQARKANNKGDFKMAMKIMKPFLAPVNESELDEGFKDEFANWWKSKYGWKWQLSTGLLALIGHLATRPELVEKLLAMIGLNEANKEEENKFHKDLDKLVHKTFGPSSDEKKEMEEGELTEANVPSNIAEFAKRKGISSLVRKVAGWAEKAGARIAGGTAIGKNYNTLILDLDYRQQGDIRIDCDEETVELYDEPVYDYKSFYRVFIEEESRKQAEHDEETLRREQGLEENKKKQIAKQIAETIKLGEGVIYEELCEKGQRYIKARQAAGEKSSAYLSGRAVKVCNGSMEWPKKGKKK